MNTKIILFSVLSYCLHAQDIVPATIELTSKEVISGVMVNQESKKVNAVKFKADDAKEFKTYQAKDIKRFTMANYHFESIDMAPLSEATFMMALVEGKSSLFYWNDDYYIKTPETFVKLKKEEVVKVNGELKKASNYGFQIYPILADCEGIKEEIQRTSFKSESLSELLIFYNECVGSEYYKFEAVKKKSVWRVDLGYSLQSVEYQSGLDFFTGEANYLNAGGSGVHIGVSRLTYPSFTNGNVSLAYGLAYSKYNFSDVAYDPSYISIPLTIKYAFLKSTLKIRPYLEIGARPLLRISEPTNSKLVLAEITKASVALPIGLGLDFKFNKSFLSLGANYESFVNTASNKINGINIFAKVPVF